MMPTWTLLGAGAIGGLFACQLSRAGIPVQVITSRTFPGGKRDHHFLQQSLSLRLRESGSETDFVFPPPDPDSPIRHLIVTTKTWQTEAAISGIRDQLDDHCRIVVMQNGMGISEWLQAEMPKATVLAATTTQGAYREDKTTIVHGGHGETWLGPLQEQHEPLARDICESWQRQGMAVIWDQSIIRRLWLKLGINCSINPLTVIYNCRNGELLKKSEALTQMKAIAEEFTAVYREIFGAVPDTDMFATARAVAEKTASNISSMRQDVLNHNPTEIDAINGYLVNRGKEVGVPCPVNELTMAAMAKATASVHTS